MPADGLAPKVARASAGITQPKKAKKKSQNIPSAPSEEWRSHIHICPKNSADMCKCEARLGHWNWNPNKVNFNHELIIHCLWNASKVVIYHLQPTYAGFFILVLCTQHCIYDTIIWESSRLRTCWFRCNPWVHIITATKSNGPRDTTVLAAVMVDWLPTSVQGCHYWHQAVSTLWPEPRTPNDEI